MSEDTTDNKPLRERRSDGEYMMKVAQAAMPANILEIITRLARLENTIESAIEKMNDKLDTIARMIGVNET